MTVGDFQGMEVILDVAIEYFNRLLTSKDHEIDDGLIDVIPNLLCQRQRGSTSAFFYLGGS